MSVQIYERALSGAAQLLEQGLVAVTIASQLPHDIPSEPLLMVRKYCVCGLSHPLTDVEQLSDSDPKQHCQIVLRDSGWLVAQVKTEELRLLVEDDIALARRLNICSIPTLLINGKTLVSSILTNEQLDQLIEQQLVEAA